MKCDKYKTIFIHIPRTGGTSIEKALTGSDWWITNKKEKHLTASEARKLYGENIWNSYFKFSFVRNPWDRIIALWSRPHIGKGKSLKQFILQYKPFKIEQKSYFYSDILDEKLDFIGKFENLDNDFKKIWHSNKSE